MEETKKSVKTSLIKAYAPAILPPELFEKFGWGSHLPKRLTLRVLIQCEFLCQQLPHSKKGLMVVLDDIYDPKLRLVGLYGNEGFRLGCSVDRVDEKLLILIRSSEETFRLEVGDCISLHAFDNEADYLKFIGGYPI